MTEEQDEMRYLALQDIAARALVELMRQDYDRVEYERRKGSYLAGAGCTRLARQAAAHAYALVLAVRGYEERS